MRFTTRYRDCLNIESRITQEVQKGDDTIYTAVIIDYDGSMSQLFGDDPGRQGTGSDGGQNRRGLLAPFEIDYEGGRVLIPAPVTYEPMKLPTKPPKGPEELKEDTGEFGIGVDWQHA